MKFASEIDVLALLFLLIPGYKTMSATLGSTQVYLTQLAKLIELSEALCGAPMTCQHRATAGNKCRCSCDKFCNYRHDCCLDVTDRKTMPDQSGIGKCVSPNDNPDQLVSVIETCVPDSTELYHTMCAINNTFIGNILVTNKDTGKTYTNLICAVCNGEAEADLVPWTPVCNTKCRAVEIKLLTGSPTVSSSTGGLNWVDWDALRLDVGQDQSQPFGNRAIRSSGSRESGNTVPMSTPSTNFWNDLTNLPIQEPHENVLSDFQNRESTFETTMQQENFCSLGFSIPQGNLGGFGEIRTSSGNGGGLGGSVTTSAILSVNEGGFGSFDTQSNNIAEGFTQTNGNDGGFGNIFTQPESNSDEFTQTSSIDGGFGDILTHPSSNTEGLTQTNSNGRGFGNLFSKPSSNSDGFTQTSSNGGGFGNIFTQTNSYTEGFTQTNSNGGGFGNLFTQPESNSDEFTQTSGNHRGFGDILTQPSSNTEGFTQENSNGGGYGNLFSQPSSNTDGFTQINGQGGGFGNILTQSNSDTDEFTQTNTNGGGFGNIFTKPSSNPNGFIQTISHGGGIRRTVTQPNINGASSFESSGDSEVSGNSGFHTNSNDEGSKNTEVDIDVHTPITSNEGSGSPETQTIANYDNTNTPDTESEGNINTNRQINEGGFGLPGIISNDPNLNTRQTGQNGFGNSGNAGGFGFTGTVPNTIGGTGDMFMQPNIKFGGGGFGIPGTMHNNFGGFGDMFTQPNTQFGTGSQFNFETNFSNYDGTVQTFVQQFGLQDPKTCNLTFEPPSGIEIAPSTCKGQLLVSNCNDQLRETLEDFELIELACREMNTPFILSPETGESVVYKNVFCFMCSGTSSPTNKPSRPIDGILREETGALFGESRASDSRLDILFYFNSVLWATLIAVDGFCGHF